MDEVLNRREQHCVAVEGAGACDAVARDQFAHTGPPIKNRSSYPEIAEAIGFDPAAAPVGSPRRSGRGWAAALGSLLFVREPDRADRGMLRRALRIISAALGGNACKAMTAVAIRPT
jgi:hypothetical protein